jgi:HEPN domain-containing protein
MMKGLYPESVVPKYLEEVKAERTALPEKMESEKGLAFAMASLGLLARKKTKGESQSQQLISGLGEAGITFAGEVGRLKKEHREADRLLRQSEMQLATADQLYNSGMTDKAVARADQAQALKSKAAELYAGVAGDTSKMYAQLENTKLGKEATIRAAEISQAGSIAGARISASKPSAQMEGVAIKAAELRRQFPDMPEAQVRDKALQSYLAQTKTGMGGVDARIDATAREKAAKDYSDAIGPGGAARKEYNEIKKKGTPEQVAAFEEKLFNKYLGIYTGETPQPTQGQPAPNAPAQQPAPAAQASPADRQAMLWANDPKNANDPRLPAIKARLGLK